jgi:hypothetical protein
MQHGADKEAAMTDGITALCAASLKGHKDMVHYLVDHGPDLSNELHGGATALHLD